MRCRFGSELARMNRRLILIDDVLVKRIFDVRLVIGNVVQTFLVRLIIGEEQGRLRAIGTLVYQKVIFTERLMFGNAVTAGTFTNLWFGPVTFPRPSVRPSVSAPECWKTIKRCHFRPTVGDIDPNKNIVGTSLGVFCLHIKITIVVKDS